MPHRTPLRPLEGLRSFSRQEKNAHVHRTLARQSQPLSVLYLYSSQRYSFNGPTLSTEALLTTYRRVVVSRARKRREHLALSHSKALSPRRRRDAARRSEAWSSTPPTHRGRPGPKNRGISRENLKPRARSARPQPGKTTTPPQVAKSKRAASHCPREPAPPKKRGETATRELPAPAPRGW